MNETARLRPWQGSRIKTAAAAALVQLGRLRTDLAADRRRVNQRVPAQADDQQHYNDSFVFQGSSDDGVMFMSRLGFREDGSLAEPWVFLDLQGEKYVNDNTSVTLDAPERERISAGGLTYRYQAAADQWRITYDGPLDRAARCQVSLTYRPTTRAYLSSAHMDPLATGRAMAEMPWSRDYFAKLRSEQQVRMEQGGTLTGQVIVDGRQHDVALTAFRDHSWGKRDWTFINRYIWNILSLGSPLVLRGQAFTHVCYTTVDYGSSFKHLVSGWIAGPSDLRPIVAASDMNLLAADGTIPETYSIAFRPKGHAPVTGVVRRVGTPQSWRMQGGDFEVNETYAQVEIGGIAGQGMAELGFARHSGIPRPCFTERPQAEKNATR